MFVGYIDVPSYMLLRERGLGVSAVCVLEILVVLLVFSLFVDADMHRVHGVVWLSSCSGCKFEMLVPFYPVL